MVLQELCESLLRGNLEDLIEVVLILLVLLH